MVPSVSAQHKYIFLVCNNATSIMLTIVLILFGAWMISENYFKYLDSVFLMKVEH